MVGNSVSECICWPVSQQEVIICHNLLVFAAAAAVFLLWTCYTADLKAVILNLGCHYNCYILFLAFILLTRSVSFHVYSSLTSIRGSGSLAQLILIHSQFFSVSFSNLVFLKSCIYWPASGFLLRNLEHLLSMLSQTCLCVISILSWLLCNWFGWDNGSSSHSLLLDFNLTSPLPPSSHYNSAVITQMVVISPIKKRLPILLGNREKYSFIVSSTHLMHIT